MMLLNWKLRSKTVGRRTRRKVCHQMVTNVLIGVAAF